MLNCSLILKFSRYKVTGVENTDHFTPFFNQKEFLIVYLVPILTNKMVLVERKHRHIVETGLALMAHASLPQHFWADAFHTAVYLINRLPTPFFIINHPFKNYFLNHQIIPSSKSLALFVGLISGRTIATNWISDPHNAFFLDIVTLTKDIAVSMSLLEDSMFPETSSLMNVFFPLQKNPPLPQIISRPFLLLFHLLSAHPLALLQANSISAHHLPGPT